MADKYVNESNIETVVSQIKEYADNTKQEKLVSGTNIKTVNSQSIVGSGDIDTKELFWCTYGTTTYAEITSALSAGKIPVCSYNDRFHVYSYQELGKYCLASVTGVNIYIIYVDTNNTWVQTIMTYEKQSNKVTTIDANSTDNQYPSAKCVYNIVGDLDSILQDLNNGGGV